MSDSLLKVFATRASDLSDSQVLLAALQTASIRLLLGDGASRPVLQPLHTKEVGDGEWLGPLLDLGEEERWAVGCHVNEELEAAGSNSVQFTYGEFPLEAFTRLLDRAIEGKDPRECTFCDLGSGVGRLVLTAAARYRWRRCIGFEALPALHALALELHARVATVADAHQATISPCELKRLELNAANASDELRSVDVLFAYSTCFDSAMFATLLANLGAGAVAITIDVASECTGLATAFELLHQESKLRFASVDELAPELSDELGEFESTACVWRRRRVDMSMQMPDSKSALER